MLHNKKRGKGGKQNSARSKPPQTQRIEGNQNPEHTSQTSSTSTKEKKDISNPLHNIKKKNKSNHNKPLLWDYLIAEEEIIDLIKSDERYKKAFEYLKHDNFKELDIEKLGSNGKSGKFYSIRLSLKHRVLLTFATIDGERCAILGEDLSEHQYEKSTLLAMSYSPNEVIRQLKNPYKMAANKQKLGAKNKDELWNSNQFLPYVLSGNKWIVLNKDQENAINMQLPFLVSGPPGSGKTSVALEILYQVGKRKPYEEKKRVVFIVENEQLARKITKEWRKNGPKEQHDVEILTYENYIREELTRESYQKEKDQIIAETKTKAGIDDLIALTPLQKVELDEALKSLDSKYDNEWRNKIIRNDEGFKNWHKQKSNYIHAWKSFAENKSLNFSEQELPNNFRRIYKEFRIRSGYSKQEYLKLGKSESLYSDPTTRIYINWLYKQYTKYLAKNNKIDLSLYQLPNPKNKADIVICDEGQDLSHGEIKNLIALTKEDKQFVICMDSHQSLYDPCSKRPFIRELIRKIINEDRYVQLPTSYRCPAKIIQFANAVLLLKYVYTGGRGDKGEYQKIPEDFTSSELGSIYWVEDTKAITDAINVKSRQCVIIFFPKEDEDIEALREKIRAEYGDARKVVTINEFKGQENHTIILHRFLESELFNEANKKMPSLEEMKVLEGKVINQPKEGVGNDDFSPEFNRLITAITRTAGVMVINQPRNQKKDKYKHNNITPYLKTKGVSDKIEMQRGFSKVLRFDREPTIKDINTNELIVLHDNKDKMLTLFWLEEGKIVNRSFRDTLVEGIINQLPEIGKASTNIELLKNLVSQYKCPYGVEEEMTLEDWLIEADACIKKEEDVRQAVRILLENCKMRQEECEEYLHQKMIWAFSEELNQLAEKIYVEGLKKNLANAEDNKTFADLKYQYKPQKLETDLVTPQVITTTTPLATNQATVEKTVVQSTSASSQRGGRGGGEAPRKRKRGGGRENVTQRVSSQDQQNASYRKRIMEEKRTNIFLGLCKELLTPQNIKKLFETTSVPGDETSLLFRILLSDKRDYFINFIYKSSNLRILFSNCLLNTPAYLNEEHEGISLLALLTSNSVDSKMIACWWLSVKEEISIFIENISSDILTFDILGRMLDIKISQGKINLDPTILEKLIEKRPDKINSKTLCYKPDNKISVLYFLCGDDVGSLKNLLEKNPEIIKDTTVFSNGLYHHDKDYQLGAPFYVLTRTLSGVELLNFILDRNPALLEYLTVETIGQLNPQEEDLLLFNLMGPDDSAKKLRDTILLRSSLYQNDASIAGIGNLFCNRSISNIPFLNRLTSYKSGRETLAAMLKLSNFKLVPYITIEELCVPNVNNISVLFNISLEPSLFNNIFLYNPDLDNYPEILGKALCTPVTDDKGIPPLYNLSIDNNFINNRLEKNSKLANYITVNALYILSFQVLVTAS